MRRERAAAQVLRNTAVVVRTPGAEDKQKEGGRLVSETRYESQWV